MSEQEVGLASQPEDHPKIVSSFFGVELPVATAALTGC